VRKSNLELVRINQSLDNYYCGIFYRLSDNQLSKSMERWLKGYEVKRHGKGNSGPFSNDGWQSSKFDIQNMDWRELREMYLPEVKMKFGPACSAIRKLWKSYKIAGRMGESRSWQAWKITEIQRAMGLEESIFPELENIHEANQLTEEEEENNGGFGTYAVEEETSEWSELDKKLLKEEKEDEDSWWFS
jgi:hypothetical protein